MKRKILYLLICLLFIGNTSTKAFDFIGGSITYQRTGGPNQNAYLITYKMFRDCSGGPYCGCPPGPIQSSCSQTFGITGVEAPYLGVSFGSFSLTVVPNLSGYEIIPPLCNSASSTICTNCGTRTPGTFAPAIEVYTFQGIVNLGQIPANCCKVKIGLGLGDCCRARANTVLVNPSNMPYYLDITIDKCVPNSSPILNNDFDIIVRPGYDQVIDLSANDPEGDSLSYHLAPSKNGISSIATYLAPYGPNQPFPYMGVPGLSPPLVPPFGLQLNPITGQLRFRTLTTWVANLVVEIKKWRRVNGVMTFIGNSLMDYQIQSIALPANNPPIVRTYNDSGTLINPNYQVVEYACPGVNLCKTFVSTDGDINDTTDISIRYQPNFTSNLTFTQLYNVVSRAVNGPKNDSVKVCWTPSVSDVSNNPFIIPIISTDRKCTLKGKSSLSFSIYVTNGPTAIINKKITGYFDRKFSYTRINQIPNNKAATIWQIETNPGSNTYTSINADSISYTFPQIGLFRIKVGLITNCGTNWINDSLQIGGIFRIVSLVEKNITCKGIPNGSIKLATVGGIGPYQYKLNNGAYVLKDTFNNLAAGTYWAYTKDVNNFKDSIQITLNEPAQAISIFTKEMKSGACYGDSTTSINLGANNAVGFVRFKMNNGNFQDSSFFKNIRAGNIAFTVIDSLGCSSSSTVNFIEPPIINLRNSLSNKIACKGDSTGSINLFTTGGLSPYTYKFDTATEFSPTSQFTGLKAGTKLVQVKDSNNCIRNFSLILTEPNIKLTLTTLVNQSKCANDKSSIVMNAAGGNSPYTYSLNNGTPTTNNVFNNLNQGTYQLMLKDSNNCSISLERIINPPLSGLQVSIQRKDISCFGLMNGEINIKANSGIKPYSFKLNSGNYSFDSSFKNLTKGQYFITTKDSLGCTISDTLMIVEPTKISTTLTASPSSCLNLKNGTASISVTGGKTPYTINWLSNPTQTGMFASNLESGLLKVVVQDSAFCKAFDSIFVPYKPLFEDENICAITCDTSINRYKIVWNKTPNKGIANYQIYRGTNLVTTIPFGGNPVFVDTNFPIPTNGIAPSYYLKSVDSCGMSSSLSDESKTIIMTSTVSAGNVNISWTPYIGTQVPSSYLVYRKIGNGNASVVHQVSSSNLSYSETFSNSQNRTYVVEALFSQPCASGIRVLSNPLFVLANSINENSVVNNDYVLFPNPASTNISIINKRGINQIKSIQVTDVSGKIIENFEYDKVQSEIKLDIQHYANGSYFVILILENGMKVNLPLQKRL